MAAKRKFTEEELQTEAALYGAMFGLRPPLVKSSRRKPIALRISLVEVFERLHRVKADPWQKDFCERLQMATLGQHVRGTRAIIHAQSQIGKSVIMAQIFPAWILGHDPYYRIALLTYNKDNSMKHSDVALDYMRSAEYKAIFPNTESHVPSIASKTKWATNGRKSLRDGQPSFNPVGLQSGFTGNGADVVLIDDPYKDLQEAISATIKPKIESKWKDLTLPRITDQTNVFGMFHRYHHEDFAGYLLATGTFDYWRYASQADGDFFDKASGRTFADPMGRAVGEYLSPRFTEDHYREVKTYPSLWASQYQGRPSADVGKFFNVDLIHKLEGEQLRQKSEEIVYWVRSWDNAATDEGGAFTVGMKVGITADGDILFTDMKRDQLDTAQRYALQLETAKADTATVPIRIPQDPGSAGKDTAVTTVKMFADAGFECISEVVSGSKEIRAHLFSLKVNSGKVSIAKGAWNDAMINELENFPLSIYKDIVDSSADGVNHLDKLLTKGNVISYMVPDRTLIGWSAFAEKFGRTIPSHWEVYVGINYNPNPAIPSGVAIMTRAAANAHLGEKLFLVGCQKGSASSFADLLEWVNKYLKTVIDRPKAKPLENVRIVVNPEVEPMIPVLYQKLAVGVEIFRHNAMAGIPETNWYMQPRVGHRHPFNIGQVDTSFYWLCADAQLDVATNEFGLLSARQEAKSWTFTDKNEPQPHGGTVLNAVRMIAHQFRTHATPLTHTEKFTAHLRAVNPDLLSHVEATADVELTRAIVRRDWERQQKPENVIDNETNAFTTAIQQNEGAFELL